MGSGRLTYYHKIEVSLHELFNSFHWDLKTSFDLKVSNEELNEVLSDFLHEFYEFFIDSEWYKHLDKDDKWLNETLKKLNEYVKNNKKDVKK
jgi:hypothetical protein